MTSLHCSWQALIVRCEDRNIYLGYFLSITGILSQKLRSHKIPTETVTFRNWEITAKCAYLFQLFKCHEHKKRTDDSGCQRITTCIHILSWWTAGGNSHQMLGTAHICTDGISRTYFWICWQCSCTRIWNSLHIVFKIIKAANWHGGGPAAPVLTLCPAAALGCQSEEKLIWPSQYYDML